MPFDNTERILKFTGAALMDAANLAETYGDYIGEVKTLIGWIDREGSLDLRPARLDVDFAPLALTDGTFAALGYWSTAALTAVANGDVAGVEEITLEQLKALTPSADI